MKNERFIFSICGGITGLTRRLNKIAVTEAEQKAINIFVSFSETYEWKQWWAVKTERSSEIDQY